MRGVDRSGHSLGSGEKLKAEAMYSPLSAKRKRMRTMAMTDTFTRVSRT